MRRVSVMVLGTAERRAGYRSLLSSRHDVAVVGEGLQLADALPLIVRFQPDVLLIADASNRLPHPFSLSTVRRLSPHTRVVLITAAATPDHVALEAARRGAHGCLAEADAARFLTKAVRAVAGGEAWFPRRIAPEILSHLIADDAAKESAR